MRTQKYNHAFMTNRSLIRLLKHIMGKMILSLIISVESEEPHTKELNWKLTSHNK